MKNILKNIGISIIVGIIIYFISTRFLFKIPSPTGIGYEQLTYDIGKYVGVISSILSFILLFIFNKNRKK